MKSKMKALKLTCDYDPKKEYRLVEYELKTNLTKNSIVVIRYYLNVCNVEMNGFEDITHDFKNLIFHEKVGVYDIRVLKFLG